MATEMRKSHSPSKFMTMKIFAGILLVVCILPTIAIAVPIDGSDSNNTVDNGQNRQKSSEALRQISYGAEQFSLEFLKRLAVAVASVNYNFIVSPFSIWSLLALTAEGAEGDTYTQLQQVLRLPEDLTYLRTAFKHYQKTLSVNTSNVEVAINQALFTDINRPVESNYASTLENNYQAVHLPVNFQKPDDAVNQINHYVNKQTHGRIRKIVTKDDLSEAQMIMISALFFRGQWKNPFNISQTTEQPFYDENEKVQGNVNMMFQRGVFSYTGITELDSLALELPYGDDNRLSMIVLLPRNGVPLTTVLEKLSAYGVARVVTELRRSDEEFEEEEVEVFLPRFSFTADFTLNVILEQMGLTDIFNIRSANLSKISKQTIYLSRIIHKAQIDVNEVGSVTSAVTGALLANKSISPRFQANRPFAFLIVEKQTNTLLFCGQVRNPGKVDFKPL